jgi:hypothetical protein
MYFGSGQKHLGAAWNAREYPTTAGFLVSTDGIERSVASTEENSVPIRW